MSCILHFLVPWTQNITLGLDPHNFKLTAKNRTIAECDYITRILLKTFTDIVLFSLLFYVCICMPFLLVSPFIHLLSTRIPVSPEIQ